MSANHDDDPMYQRREVLAEYGGFRRVRWNEMTDKERDIEFAYFLNQNKALARRLGFKL